MPRYIIYDNQISGLADEGVTEASLPGSDWKIVESDLSGSVRYDPKKKNVVAVETQPETPIDVTPVQLMDWAGLTSALRGSQVWGKAYTAAGESLKASRAFSLMLATVTSSHNLSDLLFALWELRSAMDDLDLGLTEDELTYLNQALSDNGFETQLNVENKLVM